MFIKMAILTENVIVTTLIKYSPTIPALPLSSQDHLKSRVTYLPHPVELMFFIIFKGFISTLKQKQT